MSKDNQNTDKSMPKYDPAKIEKKWQRKWQSNKIYRSTEDLKKSPENKKKFFVLDMFPYPSGEGLHVGHPKGYIATDIISRFQRMNGKSVLHPMGFDAFGLPAENYAIKTKTNPADAVATNVARFKEQLEIIGLDYDWSREINTTDPAYYKWTQWIFLQLYKKGLAYESFEPINWCPSCKTGLANEDVEDGRCERCGTPVEKKPLRQWVLKITDYAERLLADLDVKNSSGNALLDWPNSIKEAQRNWIGKSEGAEINFQLSFNNDQLKNKFKDKKITVFTTRPDTLFGVTYVVLAPEHALVNNLISSAQNSIENKQEVEAYILAAKSISEIERTDAKKEKTGVELKGVKAINPANGEEVPVWIADYVLADYGTGAVMAVPAHDDRDYAFAKKFGLEIKDVVMPIRVDLTNPHVPGKKIVERKAIQAIIKDPKTGKILCLKWKKQPWTTFIVGGVENGEDIVEAAKREILEETGYINLKLIRVLGGPVKSEFFAAHKDENRIAYFNAIYFELIDDKRKSVSQDETDKHECVWLDIKDIRKDTMQCGELDLWMHRMQNENNACTEDGIMINSGKFDGKRSDSIRKEITVSVGGKWVTKFKLRDWVFSRQRYWGEPIPLIHCEKCAIKDPTGKGVVPVPEKDLPVKLPKVASYEPTGTGESPLAAIHKWVNVKCPKCKSPAKRETNTMPQWAGSSWYYLRYMDPKNKKALVDPKKEKYWAPVDMYVGGAEHATRHLIYARFWHKFLYDIGAVSTIEPFIKLQHVGLIMGEDGRKMSKRFGNVVNPDDIVKNYGADSLRLYEMFMGPFDQQIAWSTSSIVGVRRFIEKVWRIREKVIVNKGSNEHTGNDGGVIGRVLHKTIKKVTDDIGAMSFNTAISALMITVNEIEKEFIDVEFKISKTQFEILLKLLAPFAPHVTEELWYSIGNKKSIHISEWPIYNEAFTIEDEVNIIVQVNGKVRGSFRASKLLGESELEAQAKAIPEVVKWLEGKSVKKVIVVKGKLVSIVVA